jgi:hypothetical protein
MLAGLPRKSVKAFSGTPELCDGSILTITIKNENCVIQRNLPFSFELLSARAAAYQQASLLYVCTVLYLVIILIIIYFERTVSLLVARLQ